MRRSKGIKAAKKKADMYFSKYIRLRDKDRSCATCGAGIGSYYNDEGELIIQGDAGHFISRNNANTRYDEKNVALQCVKCNRFESGRQYEFGLYIDQRWGKGTAEKLLIKSKMPASKRVQYDYEMIAKWFKEKIDETKRK